MKSRIAFLFLCFITLKAAAQLPVDVYGALPDISMMALSPSGDSVAYRTTKNGKDRVLIYNIKEKKLRGGVSVEDIRPRDIYFVNENTLILKVEKRAKLGGFKGRHDINSAFAYHIDSNKINPLLIPGDGIYKGQTALGMVIGISEDGNNAYMMAWQNAGQFSPLRVSLSGRRDPIVVKRGKQDAIDYFMDGDKVIARELYSNEENLHRVQKLIGSEWVDIYTETTKLPTRSFVGLTSDKQSLVMLKKGEYGRDAYYTMALDDGTVTGPVFNHADKDVESVIIDLNRVVYGVRYSGFTPSYDFFDKKIDTLVKQTIAELPGYSVWVTGNTADWSGLLFYMEGPDSPGDYYLYKGGELEFIASSRQQVRQHGVYQVVETKIKTRDGLRIPALLTLPEVEKLENLPAILMPHGGPESYDRMGFHYEAQYFASRGYLVIQPQFRGSDGFGLDFKLKGRGEWGRKMQDDLTDTVRTLVKSGYVDKDRVCIVGGSYGGYAALAGAAFTPDLYQCAVSINGVADVAKMLRDEERDHGKDNWAVEYWDRVIAKGEVDQAHIRNISPINHVDKITAPVLLIHGTYDKVVPFEQSEDMFDEMEDAGKVVQLVELEKGNHHLSRADNRMKSLKAIDAFVSKHLN